VRFPHRDLPNGEDAERLVKEHLAQDGRGVRVGQPERTIATLQDRHLRSKAGERLCELDADRPAAEDEQSTGEPLLLPDGFVGPMWSLGQPRDARIGCASAGTQQDVLGPDPSLLANDERVWTLEAGCAQIDVDASIPQSLRRLERVHVLDSLPDARHDAPQVDRGLNGIDAKLVRTPHVPRHLGSFQQRLARHAAEMRAVTADAVLFDEGHACAEPSRKRRRPDTG